MDNEALSAPGKARLDLQLLPESYNDIQKQVDYLEKLGDDLAERFTNRLRDEIKELRIRLADEMRTSENGRINWKPDGNASTRYARPIYRHAFSTSKIRRRNSTGRYYLFFTLISTDEDKPNVLVVVSVQHAAAISSFATYDEHS